MPEQMMIRATRDQIEEFKTSMLWKDIKRELGVWKKGFEQERAAIVDDAADKNLTSATVLMHLGDINGRIKAVDYLLSLPNIFLQILEDQVNDSERKRTD